MLDSFQSNMEVYFTPITHSVQSTELFKVSDEQGRAETTIAIWRVEEA